MKNYPFIRNLLKLILLLGLTAGVFQAQAQNRIELDNLTWFGSDSLSPGTYTKPGSPSETIVSTIPVGGPPAVFCNPTFPGSNNNGQTLLGSGGKGFFESLNDYGGTYTLTRKYKVTPGKLTHMSVRMATIPQSWLLVSNIAASIDGRSLGKADRYNSSWQQQQFVEGSQTWTPTSDLVSFVISITAPGGCHADEEILYVDQFYQVSSNILAVDDSGATVTSNGGLSLANVLANDSLNNATPTLDVVNLTQISTTNPKVSLDPATGAVNVAPGAAGGTHKVVYQICEKANSTNCSQATVTLNVTLAPGTITINKVLAGGGRVNSADQFTVNLLNYYNKSVVGTGTTKGSGSTVTAGTGTTNPVVVDTPDDGYYYLMSEAMATGSVSALSAYTTAISCQNNGSGGTFVDNIHAFTDVLSAYPGDLIVCTITNSSPLGAATLTVRQLVRSPLPINIQAPFTFLYSGNNGWPTQSLTNTSTDSFVSSPRQTLSAVNTDTTVGTTLPDARWNASGGFTCSDTTAAASGNPTGTLVTAPNLGTGITIPATYVRPGANLRCTILLGHSTP